MYHLVRPPVGGGTGTGYTPRALEGASKDTARLSLAGGIQITLIRKGPYGTQLRR